MATYTLMRDELKTCPFNSAHRVAGRRLQAHIIKCQRNSANPVLVDCPFNALHKVPHKDLQHHILLCKDSRQVIREMEESRSRPAEPNRPVVERQELQASSDNWDDDNHSSRAKPYITPGLSREVNAEEVKEEGEERPFRIKSNIEIQAMKRAERQKYYKELADRARNKQMPELTHQTRTIKDEQPSSSGSQSQSEVKPEKEEDDPSNVRKPVTNPFQRTTMVGIGRGSAPANRGGIGIGRGRAVLAWGQSNNREPGQPNGSPNVKRERPDDYSSAKRFSPENH